MCRFANFSIWSISLNITLIVIQNVSMASFFLLRYIVLHVPFGIIFCCMLLKRLMPHLLTYTPLLNYYPPPPLNFTSPNCWNRTKFEEKRVLVQALPFVCITHLFDFFFFFFFFWIDATVLSLVCWGVKVLVGSSLLKHVEDMEFKMIHPAKHESVYCTVIYRAPCHAKFTVLNYLHRWYSL